jgi:choline dehydrogenase
VLLQDLNQAEQLGASLDYVIVGAGSAGCALAARLTESTDRRILLIEAGRYYGSLADFPEPLRQASSAVYSQPGNPNSWSYTGHLTETLRYPVTRGRVVGGSSAVNGAQFMRGPAEDYDHWAELGNSEWSYAKVLPFFKALENDLTYGDTPVHGGSGPISVYRTPEDELSPVSQAFIDAALAQDFQWDPDLNGDSQGGVGVLPLNSIDGIRQNCGAMYIEPAIGRPNLFVLDRTLACRILFDGTRTTGVEIRRDGSTARIQAGEVILCTSGINSPQLLMLSGVGPAAQLRALDIDVVADSPFVGANYMDHATIGLTYELTAPRTEADAARPVAEVNLNFRSDSASGPTEDMRMFPYLHSRQAMLTHASPGSGLRSRLAGLGFLARPVQTVRGIRGASARALVHDVAHRNDLAIHCAVGVPDSRGQVTLRSADPAVTPALHYHYLSEATDRRRMREAVRRSLAMLEHASFRALSAKNNSLPAEVIRDDARLDEWILDHLGTSYHTSGTCKMGPEGDDSAVVDQYCRVRGVTGLRIVDMSVLPCLTTRGPNATAVMLGERAAALLSSDGPIG